ncbi:MAG: hypothetical protein K8T20_12975 [Planctomycetes bacterium]|nr:hypothetical protein [Planctomycetota bacterium]
MRLMFAVAVLAASFFPALESSAQVTAPYAENFDGVGVPAGWTIDPPTFGVGWGVDYDAACDPVGDGFGGPGTDGPRVGTSGGSLNYNNGVDYVAVDPVLGPITNSGTALSPVIDISGLGGTVLVSWQNNFDTGDYMAGSSGFDTPFFELTDAAGVTIPGTAMRVGDQSYDAAFYPIDAGTMGTRKLIVVDCSAAIATAGVSLIRVSFRFDTVDGSDNTHDGWFIDDLQVSCGIPDLTAPSPTPTLLSPADTSLVATPVVLDWTDSTDTSPCGPTTPSYDLFLDTVNPPVVLFASPPASTFTTPVLAPGTWFWQVRARDAGGNTTALSTVFSFTVEPPLPPLPPDSLFVNESAQTAQSGNPGFVDPVIDETPAFSAIYRDGNTNDSAIAYQFQVSTDSTFALVDFDSGTFGISPPLPKDTRCADLTVNVNLLRDTVYFWRIRFTDTAGATGPFSSAQSFRTGDDFDFGVRTGSTHHARRCYVATAMFGSDSGVVASLSAWRSGVLEKSAAGSLFSRGYATLGAPVAQRIPRCATGSLPGTPFFPGRLVLLACLAVMAVALKRLI